MNLKIFKLTFRRHSECVGHFVKQDKAVVLTTTYIVMYITNTTIITLLVTFISIVFSNNNNCMQCSTFHVKSINILGLRARS